MASATGIGVLSKLKKKRDEAFGFHEWGSTEVLQKVSLEKLKRAELRCHLDARNLDIRGNKKTMVARLRADLEAERLRNIAYTEQLEAEFGMNRDIEERGSVYGVGCNTVGQLGLGDTEPRGVLTVLEKTRGRGVVDLVVNGCDSCFALTADHEVLAWGGGGYTATMQQQTDAASFACEPHMVDELQGEDVIGMCVGASHVAAVTSGGDIFAWGRNQCGQLGLADLKTRRTPELLGYFERHQDRVHQVAAGENHTAALTRSGKVYCWGHVDSGKLGIGVDERYGARDAEKSFFPAPTLVSKVAQYCIRQIACGSAHTLARSSNGTCFAWGHGAGGRLGLGDCRDRIEPQPIPELENMCVLQIAAGTWNSAAVVLVPPLLDTGWLYTWGSGYHGQLAQGTVQVMLKPAPVSSLMDKQLSVKRVALGSHHAAALAVDGELYTWGSNRHGCLGHAISETDQNYTSEPGHVSGFGAIVERVGRGMVRSFAIGREFTLVATYPYEGPTEEVAARLMEEDRIKAEMMQHEKDDDHSSAASTATKTRRDEHSTASDSSDKLVLATKTTVNSVRHDHQTNVAKILDKGMRSARSKQTV